MIDFLEDITDLVFGNKRLEALSHFAKKKGFQFRRKVKSAGLDPFVQDMQFFDGKRKKSIKGYLFKRDLELGALNQIFDYTYRGDYGTKTTTIFLFDCSRMELPKFIIRPKGGLSKLGNIFSSTEWSSVNRDFDKDFVVESSDMNYMRMMITMQFAEVINRLEDCTIEGRGDYLVIYKKNAKIDIIDMDNMYDDGVDLLDIIINDHSNELV